MALFGRRNRIAMASVGPDKSPAYREVVQRLVELGHRRIVLLSRQERRKPAPGLLENSFLEELGMLEIPTGPYNLPDWEESRAGLLRCLDSLLQATPPTALLIDEPALFTAAQQHLARRGILAPEDISLVCTDHSPTFDWCEPSIAHISWDERPVMRRVVCWANNVSRGRRDFRKTFTESEFIPGGTIGPVDGRRVRDVLEIRAIPAGDLSAFPASGRSDRGAGRGFA
jgi:DNA-binding LacI/PurR family transcriptional regulator